MRHVSLRFFGVLIVGSANLWLVAIIAKGIISDGHATVDRVEWNSNLSSSMDRAENKKSIDSYKQILARPLLYKSREPFVAPPVAPPVLNVIPPAATSDPGFVLAGVIITSETKKAYIFTKADNAGIWANEGDDFMGWKIHFVDGTSVRLEQQGRVIEVRLYPPN
jgi:hypothetical protein